MDIKSAWYLIVQERIHRVVSQEQWSKLEPGSFELHQVFDTQRDALQELSRLVKVSVEEVREEVNRVAASKPGQTR
ncbi:MAG: hypothetical protein EBV20_10630 [Betaproteobacteria bacterium]|jgi:hypothetical protein|nr:hypothetical protein [Betaproteobacteria bacterium]NBP45093.1 hypothetical protein [Betaproteobacteria bacterium]